MASLSLSVVSVENVTLQIEGGYDADGKGPNIWDTWTEVEGAIADGSDGKVACDSYNNYEEDARIISEMGATHYREYKRESYRNIIGLRPPTSLMNTPSMFY